MPRASLAHQERPAVCALCMHMAIARLAEQRSRQAHTHTNATCKREPADSAAYIRSRRPAVYKYLASNTPNTSLASLYLDLPPIRSDRSQVHKQITR
jgi:hypothetical protein